MFTRPAGIDAFINLRPTMLDEHGWFVPFIEGLGPGEAAWARTPAVHSFHTAPDYADYAGLIEAYAAQAVRPG